MKFDNSRLLSGGEVIGFCCLPLALCNSCPFLMRAERGEGYHYG